MMTYQGETIWLNETDMCSLEHLAETSGLSLTELQELIDRGVLEPVNQDSEHYQFQMHYIVVARTARRLRDDFDLDTQGLAVALHLLRRIRLLELELAKNKN